jgi:hypothetical protein
VKSAVGGREQKERIFRLAPSLRIVRPSLIHKLVSVWPGSDKGNIKSRVRDRVSEKDVIVTRELP